MEKYKDKFEDLRVRLEKVMPNLGENYFLSVFIGRLRDDIRPIVRMLKPMSVAHAFQIAKFQEQFLNNIKKAPPYYRTFQTKSNLLSQNFPYALKSKFRLESKRK